MGGFHQGLLAFFTITHTLATQPHILCPEGPRKCPETQQERSAPCIFPQPHDKPQTPPPPAALGLEAGLASSAQSLDPVPPLLAHRAMPPPPCPTHSTQSAKAPATLSLSRTRKLPSRPARASNSSAAARLRSRWYQEGAGLPSAPPGPVPPGPGAPHAEAMALTGLSAACFCPPAPSVPGSAWPRLGPRVAPALRAPRTGPSRDSGLRASAGRPPGSPRSRRRLQRRPQLEEKEKFVRRRRGRGGRGAGRPPPPPRPTARRPLPPTSALGDDASQVPQ